MDNSWRNRSVVDLPFASQFAVNDVAGLKSENHIANIGLLVSRPIPKFVQGLPQSMANLGIEALISTPLVLRPSLRLLTSVAKRCRQTFRLLLRSGRLTFISARHCNAFARA